MWSHAHALMLRVSILNLFDLNQGAMNVVLKSHSLKARLSMLVDRFPPCIVPSLTSTDYLIGSFGQPAISTGLALGAGICDGAAPVFFAFCETDSVGVEDSSDGLSTLQLEEGLALPAKLTRLFVDWGAIWMAEQIRVPLGQLARNRPLTHFLEPQQHGEHTFELAVEVDLITAQLLQLFYIE